MQKHYWAILGICLTSLLFLGACVPDWAPMPTARIFPSLTQGPSLTPYPSLTPTPTITMTPTPITAAQINTPMYDAGQMITAQNARHIELLARRGDGVLHELALSADGSMIAAAGSQGVILYDAKTLREEARFHDGFTQNALALSPDEKTLASGSEFGQLKLWNLQSGESELLYESQRLLPIREIIFSADGSLLVFSTWEGRIHFWDITRGEEIRQLKARYKASDQLSFSEEGKFFAWALREEVQVWESESGRSRDDIYVNFNTGGSKVSQLVFSADGAYFAAYYADRVRVFRTRNGTTLNQITGFSEPIRDLALSESGAYLALLQDERVSIWETETVQFLQEIEIPAELMGLKQLQFSEEQSTLWAAGSTLALWQLSDDLSQVDEALIGSADFNTAAALSGVQSGDKEYLFLIQRDGSLSSLALEDGHRETLLRADADADAGVLYAYLDPQRLALLDVNKTLDLYSTEGELLSDFTPCSGSRDQIALSTDGVLMACAEDGITLRVWDVETQEELHEFPLSRSPQKMAFTRRNEMLVVQEPQRTGVWSLAQGTLLYDIPAYNFALSQDGSLLGAAVIEQAKYQIRIYETKTGELQSALPLTSAQFAFSADDQLLAVLGRSITLWRISDQIKVAEIENPEYGGSLLFSADGKHLIKIAPDGTQYIWGVP